MKILEIFLWIALIYVTYIQLIYILFKGKQYNRVFATFINTIVPIAGSVPTFIIACNYDKKIDGITDRINEKILAYIQIGLQFTSVLALFFPFFSNESVSSSGINMIFGKSTDEAIVTSTIILIYLLLLPVVSAFINFFYKKHNISNFITYSVSLLNVLSMILLNFVVSSGDASAKIWLWIYCYINIGCMFTSTLLMIIHRNNYLDALENTNNAYFNKKEQKSEEIQPKNSTYICSKCGKEVIKGTICECIERRLTASREKAEEANSTSRPDGYCIYCKRPLSEGEKCNCLGDGFGITIKNEAPKNRKCMYCGQILVGESTCVCEKIMKNSSPVQNTEGETEEPKRFFEEQVEKSTSIVADEISELEKKINMRFEHVKESMNLDKDLANK